jgi:hypothetical protein
MVSKTTYYCDLCGVELEDSVPGYDVRTNITLIFDTSRVAKLEQVYHGCEECIANHNALEIADALISKATSAPPYKTDLFAVTISSVIKLKKVSSIIKEQGVQ